MKKTIIILLLILITQLGFTQELANYTEKATISLDRSIYIVGENISFASVICSSKNLLSKVLYVELINPEGKQIVGKKILIKESTCSGQILIPQNLQTGNYYIRGYTKYMRNYDPYKFGYQLVKIINPYSVGVQNNSNFSKSDTLSLEKISINQEAFDIQIADSVFYTRNRIDVKISKLFARSILNASVTVVLSGAVNFKSIVSNSHFISTSKYMPETRGVSLTGLLLNKRNNEPLRGEKINLSVLEQRKNLFYSVFSDKDGCFYFSLPNIIGNRDLFLSAEVGQGVESELLVDNDFYEKKIQLPSLKFELNPEERDLAYNMSINCKIQDQFTLKEKSTQIDTDIKVVDTIPFYGKPTSILYLDDYIAMPTLEDYFNEIAFSAGIRKEKGEKQFKIFGDQYELKVYKPLVMVDLIPISCVDDILKADPKEISRIEVVSAPYVLGNIIYGGVMNIISKKNDMAGIKLPKSGMFINYKFFGDKDLEKIKIHDSVHIPDARNTLYWNSYLKFNTDNTATFSFSTSDVKGKYTIYVTGVLESGEVVSETLDFKVK